MKKILTAVFALILTISFAAAQSVDEIVDLNLQAMGGKEKLATLNTVKMSGSMSTQGVDVALTLSKLHMKGMRLDMEIMGGSNYRVANTSKGYVFMPIMGMSAAEEMNADEYKSTVTQFDVQSPLMNYKEKGNKVEFAGKEKLDGGEAYKLNITYPNGTKTTWFIDAKTNRLVKSVAKMSRGGEEMDVENSFSDYKQNKDGYWFAYSLTNMQGTIVMDNIETNVSLPESTFTN